MHETQQSYSYRIKYFFAEFIKKNPYLWHFFWKFLPRLPLLLPHERDYYGFKHLTSRENGLFLDVGANNGITAMGIRALGIKYKILSIEANSFHIPSLEYVKKKICNFDYLIVGAGDRETQLTLYNPVYKNIPITAFASFDLDYAKQTVIRDFPKRVATNMTYEKTKVKIIKLDDLNLDPHIIKIDAEGYDYHVLLGLKKTITTKRPLIMVEYTPSTFDDLRNIFSELSYALYVYESKLERFFQFDENHAFKLWHRYGLQINLFCIHLEKLRNFPKLLECSISQ